MKSKTNFKQMYLIDASTYNRISNTTTTSTSTPIVLGKSSTQISPSSSLNVSAPVTTEIPIISSYSSTQPKASIGTQSEVLHTKSVGNITNPPPTKEHMSSQTMFMNKDEGEVKDRNLRINNLDSQINNHIVRSNQHLSRNTPYTFHQPINNFQNDVIDFNTSTPTTQIEPQMMEYTSKIPIQYPPPTTKEMIHAKPFEVEACRWLDGVSQRTNNIHEQKPTIQQPCQQTHFESTPNLPIHYNTLNTEHRNYAVNSLNQDSDVLSLQHPQLMDYTTTHAALPKPQPMDITNENSSKALSSPSFKVLSSVTLPSKASSSSARPPSKALPSPTPSSKALPTPDCEECSVTTYKKYDLSLPFNTGLPDNVIFTCTICNSNFGSEKKLQRHMKNIHGAFNQVEKGIKRKSNQDKISPKKIKITREVVPYSIYNFKNLT